MSTQKSPIPGNCPSCETEITTLHVLIEYETSDGRPAVYAECPGCREVIHPE